MKTQAQFTFSKVKHDQDNDVHLVVSLTAPKIDWEKKRPSVCITLVADVSGSMGDKNKIEFAKKSMLKLVDHLQPGDYCGLVAFESQIHPVFAPVLMTQEKKDELKAKIGALRPMGGTDFSGGMLQGLEFANKMDIPEGTVNRIILFTDGQANQGVATKRDQLVKLLAANLGGATLSAFGYGSDADQELLADVAKTGKGNYAFIKNPDDAISAFAKELGGLLSIYAQNLELHMAPQNGHTLLEVVSDVDVVDDAGKISVKIPDLMGEEVRHLVFKMKLVKQAQALPRDMSVVEIAFSYDLLTEAGVKTREKSVIKAKMRFVKSGEEQTVATPAVDALVGLAQMVKAQIEAEARANAGDYAGAAMAMESFSIDMNSRGHASLSATSSKMSGKMKSHSLYTANSGYLRSAKLGASRGMGVSSMDAEAAEDLIGAGVALSNESQAAYTASFQGDQVPVHLGAANPLPFDGTVTGHLVIGGQTAIGSGGNFPFINNPAIPSGGIVISPDDVSPERAKQIQDFLDQMKKPQPPVDLSSQPPVVPTPVPPSASKSLSKSRSKRW